MTRAKIDQSQTYCNRFNNYVALLDNESKDVVTDKALSHVCLTFVRIGIKISDKSEYMNY